MIKNKKISVIGGDKRLIYLTNMLSMSNNTQVYGIESTLLNDNIMKSTSLKECIDKSNIIIGGIPMTKDNEYLYTPLWNKKISVEEFINSLSSGQLYVGCILSNYKKFFNEKGIKYVDIGKRDDFSIANAVATAEGTIQLAMEKTEYTISNSKCLVLGYGRCGKILAHKLKALGAKVTIAARKKTDMEFILAYQYEYIKFNELKHKICNFDIVINTVPTMILDKDILSCIDNDILIIDIASKPGGVDFNYCKKIGIDVYHYLGIPGIVAPKTAAETFHRTLDNILFEEERGY